MLLAAVVYRPSAFIESAGFMISIATASLVKSKISLAVHIVEYGCVQTFCPKLLLWK